MVQRFWLVLGLQVIPNEEPPALTLIQKTLEWAEKHNVPRLGDRASRLTLLKQNVLDAVDEKFDVVAALNFSYFTFKTRDEPQGLFQIGLRLAER